MPLAEDPPGTLCGYLTKHGKRNKRSWRRRFFVASVENATMTYYKTEACLRRVGLFSVKGAHVRLCEAPLPARGWDGLAFGRVCASE